MFFVLVLNSASTSLIVFRVLVYASIGYMLLSLAFYVAAFSFGYSSNFAQIRDNFPYLGRVVRLNGPMLPTAKVLGAYLLFLSLLLMLGKDLLDRWIWRLGVALSILCALLTLGRVGVAAAASAIFGLASLSANRQRWLAALAVPALVAAVAIQLVTIWHVDMGDAAWTCEVEYAVEEQTQYFGWYGEPRICKGSLDAGITYSSYFLMKLVAWNAWLSHPTFGIGTNRYVDAWKAVVGTEIPSFFEDHSFSLAQSTYLTLLAEVGVVGFTAWMALVTVFFVRIWKAQNGHAANRSIVLIWLACLAYAMIDLDVQNFRFLYVMLPLAAVLASTVPRTITFPVTHVASED